ncbi:MAG: hypothetical protein HC828_10530 [Blastochloris sp.]|nr:hypothetical protein [Blastochloris sp.]
MSQLNAYLESNPPLDADYALYCIGTAAFSFGERFMCFDSEEEICA